MIVNREARRRVLAVETAMELQIVAAERFELDLSLMAYNICLLLETPPDVPVVLAKILPFRMAEPLIPTRKAA